MTAMRQCNQWIGINDGIVILRLSEMNKEKGFEMANGNGLESEFRKLHEGAAV